MPRRLGVSLSEKDPKKYLACVTTRNLMYVRILREQWLREALTHLRPLLRLDQYGEASRWDRSKKRQLAVEAKMESEEVFQVAECLLIEVAESENERA